MKAHTPLRAGHMGSIFNPKAALRVLIVEQNSEEPERYLDVLRRLGFEPTAEIVHTNEEFREKLDTARYDLFLCDLKYPGWSAQEALLDLQRLGLETPLIVITGHLTESEAMHYVD